eukprot:gene11096-23196_t
MKPTPLRKRKYSAVSTTEPIGVKKNSSKISSPLPGSTVITTTKVIEAEKIDEPEDTGSDSRSGVLVFYEGSKQLTKAERKAAKLIHNRDWKMKNKSSWTATADDDTVAFEPDLDPNPRHSQYYSTQIPGFAEEYRAFCRVMSQELPVTFRVCRQLFPFAGIVLQHQIKHDINSRKHQQQLQSLTTLTQSESGGSIRGGGGVSIGGGGNIVRDVSWCPYTWQLDDNTSTILSSRHTPCLKTLHELITGGEALGYIVRQELVSMIPVLFLDFLLVWWWPMTQTPDVSTHSRTVTHGLVIQIYSSHAP